MRSATLILLFVINEVLSSSDECGQFKPNGNATFPWNVGIYFGNENEAELICFGSIIQSNAVLTAAHCFCDNIGGQLRDGSFYLLTENLSKTIQIKNPPSILHKIKKDCIHIHKHYKGVINFYENDLAIIKDQFNFNEESNPVCIDWSIDITDENRHAKQPIWHNNKITNEDQTYLSSSECHNAPKPFTSFITADKSCTKLKAVGLKLSHESEGAGLVFLNSDRWYIKGVLSMHDVTHSQTSTYTNINQYINWIANICA